MQRQWRTGWIRLALIEVGVLAIGAALIVALALGLDEATRALLPFGAY